MQHPSLVEQERSLTKKQIQKVADSVIRHPETLPLKRDTVSNLVDTNFRYYIGVLTRRMIHVGLLDTTSITPYELEQQRYDGLMTYIGYAVSQQVDIQSLSENVIHVDFAQQDTLLLQQQIAV